MTLLLLLQQTDMLASSVKEPRRFEVLHTPRHIPSVPGTRNAYRYGFDYHVYKQRRRRLLLFLIAVLLLLPGATTLPTTYGLHVLIIIEQHIYGVVQVFCNLLLSMCQSSSKNSRKLQGSRKIYGQASGVPRPPPPQWYGLVRGGRGAGVCAGVTDKASTVHKPYASYKSCNVAQ